MSSAVQSGLRPASGATRSLADATNSAVFTGVVVRTPAPRAQQGAPSATGTPLRQPTRKTMGVAAVANAPPPQAPPLYGWPLPQSLRQAANAAAAAGRRRSPQHTPSPASNKYSSSPHRRFSTNLQAPDTRVDATALALASSTLSLARAPTRAKQSPAPEYARVLVCSSHSVDNAEN